MVSVLSIFNAVQWNPLMTKSSTTNNFDMERKRIHLGDLNEDEKSYKILKNLEAPKIARIVLTTQKSRK